MGKLSALGHAVNFQLSELLGIDLVLAAAGGVGGYYVADGYGNTSAGVAVAATLVGSVVGAVIAAVAIVTAFMDTSFLQRLDLLPDQRQRDPSYYLAPLLFTAILSIVGGLALVVFSALAPKAPVAVRDCLGALAGFFAIYAPASLLTGLDVMVQFTHLKADAARISDDDVAKARLRRAEG